jgi:hypothetical protein
MNVKRRCGYGDGQNKKRRRVKKASDATALNYSEKPE